MPEISLITTKLRMNDKINCKSEKVGIFSRNKGDSGQNKKTSIFILYFHSIVFDEKAFLTNKIYSVI